MNELRKIWSRILGIEKRLKDGDEIIIVDALPTHPVEGIFYQFNNNFYHYVNGGWQTAVYVTTDINELSDEDGLLKTDINQLTDEDTLLKMEDDNFTDWYLPSQKELFRIIENVQLVADSVGYWTSTEINEQLAYVKGPMVEGSCEKNTLRHIRPIRSFTNEKEYSLRDIGPAGGYIFYIDNTDPEAPVYYEAAPEDLPDAAWSDIDSVLLGGTSYNIGTGLANSELIIAQTGHTASAAKDCLDFSVVFDDRIRPKNGKLIRREYIDGIIEEQIGEDVVVTTHSELVALRDASELIVGQNYLISDFAQSYNIFDGGTMEIFEEKVGALEPIIVTAISTFKFDKVAISLTRPQDIIHYFIDLLDIRDIGFGDGVNTANANFKGMIYYRKDTIQNVETYYDFRNVKFRRWAVDAELYEDGVDGVYATYTGQVSGMTTDVTLTADTIGVIGNTISLLGNGIENIEILVKKWNDSNYPNTVTVTAGDETQIPDDKTYITLDGGVDGASAYVENDVCKSGVDGKIYKCITATTGEGDPAVNTTDWVLWLDITADAFVSWTSDKTKFRIGDITTDNLIINNVTAGVDYDDFYTFGDYYNWVKNVSIGMIDLEFTIGWSYATQLNNIVFKTVNVFHTCFGNNIGSNCWNNTIGSIFVYNTIGNNFNSNTIGNEFHSNTIGNNFNSNTIGNTFVYNTIGNYFSSNTIGDGFNSNTIGNNFNSNTIGNSFSFNTIGNNFNYNTTGNSFNYNTIRNNFNSNTIGSIFVYNTIGNNFNSNTIGNNFNSNTIGNSFNSNTIGNEFHSNTIRNSFSFNTIGNNFYYNTIGDNFYKTIFGDYCQYNTIANKVNGTGTNKIITFGDSITMCNIQDFAFGVLAADLDLTAATHIRGAYNTTIYQDAVDGVKLSYMTGGVLTIADVTD